MIRDQKLTQIDTTDHTHIMWMVNDTCPFKCWYCPEATWNGRTKHDYTWDECSHAIDLMVEKFGEGYFILTGGEPTDWIYYTNMMEKIHDTPNWNVTTVTNLSKKLPFLETYLPYNIAVNCSYHPNVIKTDKQRELWFEKVNAIKDKTLVAVRLMLDPKHFDHCVDMFNKLNDEKIFCEVVRISNFIDGYIDNTVEAGESLEFEYTEDQLKIIETLVPKTGVEYANIIDAIDPLQTRLIYANNENDVFKSANAWSAAIDLNHHKRNKFKGWSCQIGMNNLFITPKGEIAKSVCKGCRQQMLSSIKDIDNMEWPDRPTICEYEWCFCEPEVLIKKKKV